MLLTNKHTKQYAVFYAICFVVCSFWHFYLGRTLSSISPIFFLNRLDISLNILLLTNIQHYIIENKWLQICLDFVYFLLPILLAYSFIKNKNAHKFFAISTSLFSIVYLLLFSIFSIISIEVFIAWMFVPLVFYASNSKSFYFMMHILRLLFLLFFLSTAIWKISTGAFFNIEQMSAILQIQHPAYLAENPNTFYAKVLNFYIKNENISYLFYASATLLELSFLIGFFTKKYDKILIVFFCLFLTFDYFLMGINYTQWLPFMGCLYFSKYKLDES
ncbi:MAG: hypothetical protein HOO89_05530 [Ferruginibacter sp.]|nr:hypothetical protein [Ferruginibacter sp.]